MDVRVEARLEENSRRIPFISKVAIRRKEGRYARGGNLSVASWKGRMGGPIVFVSTASQN